MGHEWIVQYVSKVVMFSSVVFVRVNLSTLCMHMSVESYSSRASSANICRFVKMVHGSVFENVFISSAQSQFFSHIVQ